MKRIAQGLLILMILCLLPIACKTDGRTDDSSNVSAVWDLGSRYPITYGTMRHAYTYIKDGKSFYLIVSRSKRFAGSSENVIESKTVGDRVYALCKSRKTGDDTKSDYTFYECPTGTYVFTIIKEESDFHMESILSMDQAIELIEDPHTEIEGLSFEAEEWSGYYRLASCNLEISLFPNDAGAKYRKLAADYPEQTEDGERYLYHEADGTIVYTDDTSTAVIKQSNRSGSEHTAYNTIAECKALLALLG